ncbi:anaerobic ribonucleoside triphosphate reductase [Niallia sp. MER 6]|uniref:anaerobic ribonucleoside triphosphate reductase n=1 Tax=Niallia sp. MER 6 TaxID=2939567 RepID=UPI0020413CE8|nr:anaerobic ribonucleoside triphosphate reductase [Niallia sp. MER 6]MCM3030531.1 anaerobic ribonucleoside triphosphate reductase [Niallia sp. MER 6]
MGTYEKLMNEFADITTGERIDLIQENANMDGVSPMSHMMHFASASTKHFTIEQLLSEEAKNAYLSGYIHIHDLDFYASGTATCCQIPVGKILKEGFNTGHGYMREPKSIMSAMALTSIILQANQNQQHGGQAVPLFDYDLAPYIKKSYMRHKNRLEGLFSSVKQRDEIAWKWIEEETYQACEAFVHNCNSMHSRGGGQTPFVSVNLGTDISVEGRLLTKSLLLAVKAGLGKGETPIFPIIVFKVKEGINYSKEDINYDLFQLAIETTSKRLFPNFLFLDAPFNKEHYDGTPESEAATMGCRTRVMGNIHGSASCIGRGNLSFTSLNLPLIALESNTVEDFFTRLDSYIHIAIEQLYDRYEYQGNKKAANFKFLFTQGVWKGGEALSPEDNLEEIWKQGTLSLGFVGLAEALVALTGYHHGESEEAYKLGLKIVAHMRKRTDEATKAKQMNYSLIATPAESFAGKAQREVRKKYGIIKRITDRPYFTNSFHIPVHYKIMAIDKIEKEAPFHPLTNGGHITYLELDGDASKNLAAMEQIVRAMKEAGIGYGSINHPVDRCLACGYKGVINNSCPSCNIAGEENFERIRRITGYLVGSLDKWNSAKRSEEKDRVKHR